MKGYVFWLSANRGKVLLIASCLFIVAISGALNLKFSTDFRVYLSADHPDVQQIDLVERKYTKNETLFVGISPTSDSAYSEKTLTLVAELTRALWQTPYARRVDSLTNFQYSHAQDDDIFVRNLYKPQNNSASQSTINEKVREIAQTEPLIKNFLAGEDGRALGIQITLQLSDQLDRRMQQTPEAVTFVRNLIERTQAKHPDYEYFLAGSVLMNQVMGEAALQDTLYLVPFGYLVIILLMAFLMRSFIGIALTLGTATLSNGFVFGIIGWTDPILAPVAGFVPNAILVIAVADCIHLLTTYYAKLSSGESVEESLASALSRNFNAITLTSITTIIGFLCLNFNESPPYRDLGNMIALGCLFAYVISVVIVPALLLSLPISRQPRAPTLTQFMPRLSAHIVRRSNPYFFLGCAALGVFCYLATYNQFEDNWNNYFDHSFQLRQDSDAINRDLTGLHRVDFDIEVSGTSSATITSVEYLQFVSQFSEWLRTQAEVRYVSAIPDTIARLNKNMHGDDITQLKLPDSDNLSAQYLLLYEMSLPYGLDLTNQVAFDKRASRVTAILDKSTSEQLLTFSARAQTWSRQNGPDSVQVSNPVGLDVAFANLSRSNIKSMLWGTALAFTLISLLIGITFRSFIYGFISIFSNVTPAIVALGIWAVTASTIGLATSAVISMAIGIIVDDTIHFLSKYRYARNALNYSPEASIEYAHRDAGTAILTTSIILAAGFLVLGLSPFEPTSQMGNLLALTIVTALVIDLVFLPCLLLKLDPQKKPKPSQASQNESLAGEAS
ncbi:RND family transporter [Microbulbifer sp. ALW1]|uniref:efflux RND transporter permease subunit n=1 Tax=Microbulbifer sp. (strain ALW1) TaxID=1516059 RepID=UPI001358C761|nr:MMPL family transporter [Microbulbifer sp. ALW1]